MVKIRWGYSNKKRAIWFYKQTKNSRSICWSWSQKDLKEHFSHGDFTNLEYLEGLDKLKEKLR